MKFLIKAVLLSGKRYGQHYYIRPGGYIVDSCQPNNPDYCYYPSFDRAQAAKESFERWNAWYWENYQHVSELKKYRICRVA